MLYNTYLGGFIVHAVTVFPWLLGGASLIAPILFAVRGDIMTAATIACLVSVQYFIEVPAWPAFAALLKKLNPRAYYRRCSLGGNLESIRDSKTLLSYHPHGMLTVGFSWNGCHAGELMSKGNIVWLVVDVLCNAPLFGYVIRWMGNIQGASAKNMKRLMSTGNNVALLPGGFEEATIQRYGVDSVYIKERKGFIKYALQYGYRVHPCYTFGECDTFVTFTPFRKLRLFLNTFKFPAVLFIGSYICPLFPRSDCDVHTVIGDPIAFPHIEEPTREQIEEWHGKYVSALRAVFDKHKAEVGKPDAILEVH